MRENPIRTISDLRNAVTQYTVGMREHRWNPDITTSIWNKLLHDRRMPKRRISRKRGGASYELAGAPLDYAMIPGSAFTTNPTVAVYDRFPIDPTVNPQVVSDLDVFFQSGLSQGCGVENTTMKVPDNMGSNKVGGRRMRSHSHRRSRKYRGGAVSVSPANFLDNLATRTGDLASTIANHAYMSTARPTMPHSLTHQWQGRVDTIPTSADPTNHTWKYASEQPKQVADALAFATDLGPTVAPLYRTTVSGPSSSYVGGRRSRKNKSKNNRKTRGRKSNRKSSRKSKTRMHRKH